MLTILLPAYNEAAALPKLIPALADALADQAFRILVVDDGSADATPALTRELAHRFPVVLVSHPTNQGLGQAMATGIAWVVAHAGDPATEIIITLDADNTHPATLIPALIAPIIAGTADVVIASRYAPGGGEIGLAPHRHVLSRGASWLLSTAFHIPGARDYTCGFRAYRCALLATALDRYAPSGGLVTERGFACMAEILIKLSFIGARVEEVGLMLRYDLKEGASKLRVGRTIQQYLALITRLRKLRRTI